MAAARRMNWALESAWTIITLYHKPFQFLKRIRLHFVTLPWSRTALPHSEAGWAAGSINKDEWSHPPTFVIFNILLSTVISYWQDNIGVYQQISITFDYFLSAKEWKQINDIVCSQTSCAVLSHCFGKVRSLSESLWHMQPIKEQLYELRIQIRFS